jgi:predicted nucleotidyltransferase component of viral defense system
VNARRAPVDVSASVRARLYSLAREQGVELQRLLSEFAIERLLYRLGASAHRDRFVLKGATLFRLWSAERSRATWDVDLLGRGAGGVGDVAEVMRALCAIQDDDGLHLDPGSVQAEEIRAPEKYGGVRVRLVARLGTARIPLQVDVGFGDAVVPAPSREKFPTLLGHAAPDILVYPPEVVVAEKLEAMISLGHTNSRMKDFYDVFLLSRTRDFDGDTLARAIRATFTRRRTPLPDDEPVVLTTDFLSEPPPGDPAALRLRAQPGPVERRVRGASRPPVPAGDVRQERSCRGLPVSGSVRRPGRVPVAEPEPHPAGEPPRAAHPRPRGEGGPGAPLRAGGKRGSGGGSAPFVYCGEVRFVEWEGEAPITVRWRLGEGVPGGVAGELVVPPRSHP